MNRVVQMTVPGALGPLTACQRTRDPLVDNSGEVTQDRYQSAQRLGTKH